MGHVHTIRNMNECCRRNREHINQCLPFRIASFLEIHTSIISHEKRMPLGGNRNQPLIMHITNHRDHMAVVDLERKIY